MPWEESSVKSSSTQSYRVAVACDHMGIGRKTELIQMLQQLGHVVHDHGAYQTERCDYPDYAAIVANAVASGKSDWGLLICGTGAGMCIAANKVLGVRAALVSDTFTAKMTRRHNNANVLCLGSWVVGEGLAREILEAWLGSAYEGGRHQRRVDKVCLLEKNAEQHQSDLGAIERLDVGKLDVLTMGEMLVEIMRPEPGTALNLPGNFQGPFPSGAPAIFIDTVARLGFSAAIVGGVGDDDFGSNLRTRLERSGVRSEFVSVVPSQSTGTAHVSYFEDGSRKFVFHIAGTAAVSRPVALPASPPRVVHVMGCSLMASDSMRLWILQVVADYYERGSQICFDPNIRKELLGGRCVLDVVGPILDRCTVLLPGLPELRLLASSCSTISIDSPELTEARCVDLLLQRFTSLQIIVVKHGSDGASIFARGESQPLVVQPVPVKEVDATGAGDCFDAAFVCGITAGLPLIDCGRLAARAGAACATAFGPMEGKIDRTSLGWGDGIDFSFGEAPPVQLISEDEVMRFADIAASKFKVIAFDMDHCAVRQHSRGSLRRDMVGDFARSISPDFVAAVTELSRRGVGLAIATHSDLAEHSLEKPCDTYIFGEDLVREVLRSAVPEYAHLFFIVAFNPRARGTLHADDQAKKRHLRAVAAFYNVEISDCALFDDDPENCRDTQIQQGGFRGKFSAFKSDPEHGFQLKDLQ